MRSFRRVINYFVIIIYYIIPQERTFSTLETKRVKAAPYKITFFDDGNCQGDTKHKWSVMFYRF